MKFLPRLKTIVLLFCFVLLFSVCESQNTQVADNKLSKSRYIDPKGYFKIVPPDGWRVQEFPQDTRGKVAFVAPESNVDLRVLVNAVDFNTIEDLIAFCKDVENRIGINTNIERTTFGVLPAVKRTFQAKGIKFYYIDFLIGQVDHNIAYGAPTNSHEKYLPIVMQSIETYEPIIRDVSNQDLINHIVSKKIRLAQLMIQNGNFDLALDFVKEGLEAAPDNSELLNIKKQIEDKRKK